MLDPELRDIQLFSVHAGGITQSSCACGEQFPVQGSCQAWSKHILALSDQPALDRYVAERVRKAKLETAERWYEEFVWPWRADDEDADDKAKSWIAELRTSSDRATAESPEEK